MTASERKHRTMLRQEQRVASRAIAPLRLQPLLKPVDFAVCGRPQLVHCYFAGTFHLCLPPPHISIA